MSRRGAGRAAGRAGWVVGVAALATLGAAVPAKAEPAVILHPTGCGWALQDDETEVVPGTGITEDIEATACQVVISPDGVHFSMRGQGPADYSATRAVVDRGRPGVTVVSPSGRINGTGHFR
jgi:hypothetical protein